MEHPEFKHGAIKIAFTPDEEVGRGVENFSVKDFGADFAYTMDGDTVAVMSDETFNAASAEVKVQGFSIHPGEAKNKLKNAARIAAEYISLLPAEQTPEHTEGREGFIHLTGMKGATEQASLSFILRDHDRAKLAEKKVLMESAAEYLNRKYGEGTVSVKVSDSYRNMKEVLADCPEVSEIALRAIRDIGYEPQVVPVRGGTDGSNISFMGLPCPNLGAGGGNFHGPYEYCVVEELEDAVKLILRIAALTAEE